MKIDYIIIAGGQAPVKSVVNKLIALNPDAKLVAVDHGYDHWNKLKIQPHLFVGDGDSLVARKVDAQKTVWLSKNKSVSDLEFVLKTLPQASTKVVLGGYIEQEDRMDHAFVNLLLGLNYKNVFFLHKNSWMTGLCHQTLKFKSSRSVIFSIISPYKIKISIRGSRFDANNLVVTKASHGLSNQTLAQKVTTISVSGRAILFVNQSFLRTQF